MQAVIDNGKKVDEKEIMYLTEMFMRQLLKLDGIDAEGEGKVQRKAEVSFLRLILLLRSEKGLQMILTFNYDHFDMMKCTNHPLFVLASCDTLHMHIYICLLDDLIMSSITFCGKLTEPYELTFFLLFRFLRYCSFDSFSLRN